MEFECAAIADNLIAVGYQCIVYILVWNPPKPKITQSRSQSGSLSSGQTVSQLPAVLQPVTTLCFPFIVKSMAAATICTRSFLVVACDQTPTVFLFRLDDVKIALQTEDARKRIWAEGEKQIDSLKRQLPFLTVQRPDPSLIIQNGIINSNGNYFTPEGLRNRIQIGKGNDCTVLSSDVNISPKDRKSTSDDNGQKNLKFVEVMSGSHTYVEVQCSSRLVMTRIFDSRVFDRPIQMMLTTLSRQIRIFSPEEIEQTDGDPYVGLSPLAQTTASRAHPDEDLALRPRCYMNNEGAVLIFTGADGIIQSCIIPLSAMLDFPPEKRPKNRKPYQAEFFFPPLMTHMWINRKQMSLTEDEGIIYVYGDRASALTWSDRASKFIWTTIDCNGTIHSLVPLRVSSEDLQSQLPPTEVRDDEDEGDGAVRSVVSKPQNNRTVTNKGAQEATQPHPTLAWIGYADKTLTFGTTDKRRSLIREVKEISSLPIAVAHVPSVHAIAVLCREHSQYPHYLGFSKENVIIDQASIKSKHQDKKDRDQDSDDEQQTKSDTDINSAGVVGLGMDVSAVIGPDQQRRMAYHEIFMDYLKEKNEERREYFDLDDYSSSSPIGSPTSIVVLQNNSQDHLNIFDRDTFQLKGQFFQESISKKDHKGIPFTDIANDWVIETHSKHYKDYRPKRLAPSKYDTLKTQLCYAPRVNFCLAWPPWMSAESVLIAMKTRQIRLNKIKKSSVYVTENELKYMQDTQTQKNKETSTPEINQDLSYPRRTLSSQQIQSKSPNASSHLSPISSTGSLRSKKININTKSFDQFVKAVSNSYIIVLYDEMDMRMRIGEANLSHLNLDIDKIKDSDSLFSEQQNRIDSQPSMNSAHSIDSFLNINSCPNTTDLYNFFTMACVSIPTKVGVQKVQSYVTNSVDEIQESVEELNFDTRQLNVGKDKMQVLYKQEDLSVQQIIDQQMKMMQPADGNQDANGIAIKKDVKQIQIQPPSNDMITFGKILGIEQVKQKEPEQEFLDIMSADEYNERYTRSLLCVAGRESTVGRQRMDLLLKNRDSSTPSNKSQQLSQQLEDEETIYETMFTDIFIFEVQRMRILENARHVARDLLEKQFDINEQNNQKDNEIDDQQYFRKRPLSDEEIQKALAESSTAPHTFPVLHTSPMASVYNKMSLLNVQITLHKRIRLLGGVQGLFTYPSTLVALNGRSAFIFSIGPRNSDTEVNLHTYLYQQQQQQTDQVEPKKKTNKEVQNLMNETENQQLKQNLDSNSKIEVKNKKKDIFDSFQYCSCCSAMYNSEGEIFPTLPFHASISCVRSVCFDSGYPQHEHFIPFPKKKQYYSYNNESPAFPVRPVESYEISSPFVFNLVLAAFIIAPSPITNFSIIEGSISPQQAQIPSQLLPTNLINGLSDTRQMNAVQKITNKIPQMMYLPLNLRCAIVYAPCGYGVVDVMVNANVSLNSVMPSREGRICVYNPQDSELFVKMIERQKKLVLKPNAQIGKKTRKKKKEILNIQEQEQIYPQLKSDSSKQLVKRYIPASLQAFYKPQYEEKIEFQSLSLMPMAFVQHRCPHCGKINEFSKCSCVKHTLDGIKYTHSKTQTISQNTLLALQHGHQRSSSHHHKSKPFPLPDASQNNFQNNINDNPPMNESDLAFVSGQYMQHRQSSVIKAGAIFFSNIFLRAQGYAPSLVVDAQMLAMQSLGVIIDGEVLIYQLVPNPLHRTQYKKIQQKKKGKFNKSINKELNGIVKEDDNDPIVTLPLCFVLHVRIPVHKHVSFIMRCCTGMNSLYSGIRNNFLRRMVHNRKMLESKKFYIEEYDRMNTKRAQKRQGNYKGDDEQDLEEQSEVASDVQDANSLQAEDLESEYYLRLVDKGEKSNLHNLSLTPKGQMSNFPEIPSFMILSRQGYFARAIPNIYDYFPLKDIMLAAHILAILDMNFGDIWKHRQTELFKNYLKYQEKCFNFYVIEEAMKEWAATGIIARRPPVPMSNYLSPAYSLKGGRYFEGQTLFGISPLPVTAEWTHWKVLHYQNMKATIARLATYMRNFDQRRLITREFIRRILNEAIQNQEPSVQLSKVSTKNGYELFMKAIAAFRRIVAQPALLLQKDCTNEQIHNLHIKYKQVRIGIKQLKQQLSNTVKEKETLKEINGTNQANNVQQMDRKTEKGKEKLTEIENEIKKPQTPRSTPDKQLLISSNLYSNDNQQQSPIRVDVRQPPDSFDDSELSKELLDSSRESSSYSSHNHQDQKQDIIMSLYNTTRSQSPQLQRVQYSKALPRFSQQTKDVDWGESTGQYLNNGMGVGIQDADAKEFARHAQGAQSPRNPAQSPDLDALQSAQLLGLLSLSTGPLHTSSPQFTFTPQSPQQRVVNDNLIDQPQTPPLHRSRTPQSPFSYQITPSSSHLMLIDVREQISKAGNVPLVFQDDDEEDEDDVYEEKVIQEVDKNENAVK
ncbi:MAG: hypothetical protein EZS28_013666 [Streblomastix strix]|uniref:Uncharacterized protein n=1 Tax=Streblomastix strix TaxID=222440 RepID=A0A5J4W7H6_9EUKA|nr:MAG: hypothetical protein EZS28_013666 [Streblomastix strix]